jgi:hypothetical protein
MEFKVYSQKITNVKNFKKSKWMSYAHFACRDAAAFLTFACRIESLCLKIIHK